MSVAALAWAEREGAAPGAELRLPVSPESSPVSSGRRAFRAATRNSAMALALGCVAVAAWHVADAAWLHAKAALGQLLLARAWNESKATGTAAKPWPWADTHPVARLAVPALQVERLVLAGASGRGLAWGPGHVTGSALPGQRGTTIVTAHRDTHFAFLRDLEAGHRIVVETAKGASRSYRVERSLIADHRALKLPVDDHSSTLVLVTCYPFDAIDPGTPLRYAVIARAE